MKKVENRDFYLFFPMGEILFLVALSPGFPLSLLRPSVAVQLENCCR